MRGRAGVGSDLGRQAGKRLRVDGRRLWAYASSRRRLARALTGTVGTGLLVQLTLIGTGVLLARALGPVDRGHFAFLTLIAALSWRLGPIGVPQALTYYIGRETAHARTILKRIRGPYLVQIAATVVLTALALAILVRDRPGYVQIGALVVVATIPSSIIQQASLAIFQGLRAFKPFNLWRLFRNGAFLVLGGALYLLGVREFVPLAIAWGVSRVIGAPMMARGAYRRVKALPAAPEQEPSIPRVAEVRSFGRRSLLGASSPIETFRLDQLSVAFFLAPVALGYYVVALALTNLPRFIGQAIGQVANPYVARIRARHDALRLIWRFTALGGAVLVPLIAAIWIAAPAIVDFFFGAEFSQSVPIVRILLVAALFYGVRRVLSDAARGAGLPLPGSVAEVLSVVTAIGLFPILIPAMGAEGAAVALVVASVVALAVLTIGVLRAPRAGPSLEPMRSLDQVSSPE